MASRCNGARKGYSLRCNGSIYKCLHCGSSGCMQTQVGTCSEQGFDVSTKCLKCGTVGKMELQAPEAVGMFSTLMHDPN